MSTSEKFTNVLGKCPCGRTDVLEHVDSPDNAYSKTTYEYELDCPLCAEDWEIDGRGRLNNRAAKLACSKACSDAIAGWNRLTELASQAIDSILLHKGMTTPKDERAVLLSAGLCGEGPIRYKRLRESGKSPGSLCDPRRNMPWIVGELGDPDLRQKIDLQIGECQRLDREERRVRDEMVAQVRDMKATG